MTLIVYQSIKRGIREFDEAIVRFFNGEELVIRKTTDRRSM